MGKISTLTERLKTSTLRIKISDDKSIPYDVVPVFSGAYLGFCNAHGIGVGSLESVAKYGPIFLATTMSLYIGLCTKLINKITSGESRTLENELSFTDIGEATAEVSVRTGTETAIGYGLGYLVGYLTR